MDKFTPPHNEAGQPDELQIAPKDEASVIASMEQFVTNNDKNIQALIQQCTMQPLGDHELAVTPFCHCAHFCNQFHRMHHPHCISHVLHFEPSEEAQIPPLFAVDGVYGFGIALKGKTDPVFRSWLGIVSFLFPFDLHEYDEKLETIDDLYPLIIQLQRGKLSLLEDINPSEAVRTKEVLQSFRWQRFLLHLSSLWAKDIGFHQIGMLPSSMISYVAVFPELKDPLYYRYDVTGRRCGFIPNEQGILIRAI